MKKHEQTANKHTKLHRKRETPLFIPKLKRPPAAKVKNDNRVFATERRRRASALGGGGAVTVLLLIFAFPFMVLVELLKISKS